MSEQPTDGSVSVDWHVYQGTGQVGSAPCESLPAAPPWRRFVGAPVCSRPADDGGEAERRIGGVRGVARVPDRHELAMVNAAIYLRRPLLVTGRPGTGKSSLAVTGQVVCEA